MQALLFSKTQGQLWAVEAEPVKQFMDFRDPANTLQLSVDKKTGNGVDPQINNRLKIADQLHSTVNAVIVLQA